MGMHSHCSEGLHFLGYNNEKESTSIERIVYDYMNHQYTAGNILCIYIYTWNPNDHCFHWNPDLVLEGPRPKNRGNSQVPGITPPPKKKYIYIYTYIKNSTLPHHRFCRKKNSRPSVEGLGGFSIFPGGKTVRMAI